MESWTPPSVMTSGEQGMPVAKSDTFEGHQVYIFVGAAKTAETLKDSLDLWNISTTLFEVHK